MSRIDSKTDTKSFDATAAQPSASNGATNGAGAGATSHTAGPALPSFAIPGAEMWTSFVKDQLGRLQTWSEEVARLESMMFDRVRATASDAGRMFNDSIDYVATASAQLRKQALDASRRVADLTVRS